MSAFRPASLAEALVPTMNGSQAPNGGCICKAWDPSSLLGLDRAMARTRLLRETRHVQEPSDDIAAADKAERDTLFVKPARP